MSTRSTSSNLYSPLRDPESLIRRRNLGEPSSLFDFEEVMSIPYNNMGPPLTGPPPPNNNGPPPMVRPNEQAPRSMEELCQPSINGRGRPIAPILIQATDFGLRHHMIQPQNGVSDDALRLSLFPYSLTHHATAWHRDTINAAAGGTFMQKTPEECYELIKNMTAHHNHWDTSDERGELTRSTTSSSPEIATLNKKLDNLSNVILKMSQSNQQVNVVNQSCETCGSPYSYTECPTVDGYTQEAVYATMGNHNLGGNSYQPQGDRNLLSYRSNNYLRPPGFNQPNVQNNQNRYNQNQGKFQTQNYQAPPQVGPSNELTNYMKTNDVNMRAMQNQISNIKTKLKKEMDTTLSRQNNVFKNELKNELTNDIKNMMSNFFQMQNPSGSRSLLSNIVANPRGDVKAITTRSGVAYNEPTMPPTPSPLPKEVERETDATKKNVKNTSLGSTAHVQPLVVQD
ncbi:hypothetical protein Tco_1445174, partial [Tanacetum coccineum]